MRQYGVTPYILGAYSDCGFQLVAMGKRNAPGNPTNARFIYSDNVEKPVGMAEKGRFQRLRRAGRNKRPTAKRNKARTACN